jgi:hypothetical protein
MKLVRGLALAALLGAAGAVTAQIKPPVTGPTPPVETLQNEAVAFKELAARVAAERWLALIDAADYGKAWDQCSKVFREKVTRDQWTDGLPKTRGALGTLKSRRADTTSYKTSIPGMPSGEYVTVLFVTSFEQREDAQELVTLVFEDGTWRPLGYGVG